MAMSYSKNPNLPKVRMQAVKLLRTGLSTREVARHFGYAQSTIVKWNKKLPPGVYDFRSVIPTDSSRPKHHPRELDDAIVGRILELREQTKRGAEFIHVLLIQEGIKVSLSSVKRTLSRPHMGLNWLTPAEQLAKVIPRS